MLIVGFVGYFFIFLISAKLSGRYLLDFQIVETVWTVVPGIILIFLAAPSLQLLYYLDEINNRFLTVKVTGHQWYWSYEYSDFTDFEYDSFIVPEDEIGAGEYRLLEVDHRLVIPCLADIQVLVTAADVLHSWSLPSLGIKVDAVPGRLNQLSLFCSRVGVYYGQCSEICGANHSFIPIVVESVCSNVFISLVDKWA